MILALNRLLFAVILGLTTATAVVPIAHSQELVPGVCSPESDHSVSSLDGLFSQQSYFDVQARQVSADFAFDLTGSSFVRSSGLSSSGKMAIIDQGFEAENLDAGSSRILSGALQSGVRRADHGTGTTNLALEASAGSQVTALIQFEDLYDSQKTDALIERMKSSGTRVVNISYTMGDDPRIRANLIKIRDSGITIVASSGNFGKHFRDEQTGIIPGPQMHMNNQIPGIIYVGSISQYGTIDDYSRTGAAMTIMAPVGDALGVKFDQNGEFRVRGTSFAAPQITAAIADVQGILPNISSDEVQELMLNASIQTINGPMLNHLRMVEVAQKLKSEGWPSNRGNISNPEYFSLSEQAQARLNQISSARSESQRISLLQQAYLLDPEGIGESARQKLAELKSLGTISDFYRSLDLEHSQDYLAELAQSENEDVREMARRSAALLTPSGQREIYTQAFASRQSPVLTTSLEVLTTTEDPFFVQNLPDERLLQVAENLADLKTSLLAQTALHLKYSQTEFPKNIRESFQQRLSDPNISPFDREIYRFALDDHQPGKRNYFATLSDRLSGFRDSKSFEPATRKRAVEALSALPLKYAVNRYIEYAQDPTPVVKAEALKSYQARLSLLETEAQIYSLLEWLKTNRSPQAIREVTITELLRKSKSTSIELQKNYHDGGFYSEAVAERMAQILLGAEPQALAPFIRIYYLDAPDSLTRSALATKLYEASQLWRKSPQKMAAFLNQLKSDANIYIQRAAIESLSML